MRPRLVLWSCVLAVFGVGAGLSVGQPPRGQRSRSGSEAAGPAAQPRGLQPQAFAIVGVRVVTEPGKVLTKAPVVIRDGLIEGVGPDLPAPPDALVIAGAGLTVYPGFVDACGHWGHDPALRRSEVGP